MGGCGGRQIVVQPKYERKHSDQPDRKQTEQEFKSFDEAIKNTFPGAIEYKTFHKHIAKLGEQHGFVKDNTIAMYSVCRDELTEHFVDALEATWGESFNISSLAGFVFCGKTGFQAGMAHAPKQDGVERYLLFCGPHIGISEDGKVGAVWRGGRDKISHACGALMAFHEELKEGKISVKDDPQDLEQTSLKQYLLEYIKYGEIPTLVELCYKAQQCIFDMVEHTLEGALSNKQASNYLVISAILIHGPKDTHYVWVGDLDACMQGKRVNLKSDWQANAKGN